MPQDNPDRTTPDLTMIMDHAREEEDWDSGYVCQWPQIIIKSLE